MYFSNFWPTYLCPTVLKLSDQHQQNTKYTLWFLSPSIPTTSTYSLPPSNGSRNTTHCSAGKLQWRGMPVPLLWCLCPERRYWQNFSCNREMVTWCRDKIRWNDSEMVASIFWKKKLLSSLSNLKAFFCIFYAKVQLFKFTSMNAYSSSSQEIDKHKQILVIDHSHCACVTFNDCVSLFWKFHNI